LTRIANFPIAAGTVSSGAFSAILEATKPGITRLVVITSGVGFAMAAMSLRVAITPSMAVAAIAALLGTALTASGANALNQAIEWRRDARMPRTSGRPIPSGRASLQRVVAFSMGLCVTGLAILGLFCGLVPALIALVTILSYVLIYTPLKPVTHWATVIGAVPGALPPLIGWTAAQPDAAFGALAQPGGWAIFAIIFVWQLPHFLAIAWKYRDDYRLGGYKVLPVIDPSGRRTSRAILFWTALLIPVSALPAMALNTVLGPAYVVFALLAGAFFAWPALRLARTRHPRDAMRTFIASVLYLPAILLFMSAEAILTTIL
jgi:protoheme IX farnesyltransferase